MRIQSPGTSGSSSSRPMFTTRLTPSTLTIARSSWSVRISTISPGMPRHMRSRPHIERILRYRFRSGADCRTAAPTTAVTTSTITSRTFMPTSFEQVTDEVDDRVRGAVDDRGHRFREPDPLVDRRGLAAHDEDPLDGPRDADALRELVEHRQDGAGVHAVRVERAVVRGPVQVVFEQVERAGRVTVPYRVDEDERAVAVEQPVGEVHATDADVRDLPAGGQVAA